jgi:hypothetical protein
VSTFGFVGTLGVSPVSEAASIWPALVAMAGEVDEVGPSCRHQIRPEARPNFVLMADLEAAQIESVHFRNSRLADDEDTHAVRRKTDVACSLDATNNRPIGGPLAGVLCRQLLLKAIEHHLFHTQVAVFYVEPCKAA